MTINAEATLSNSPQLLSNWVNAILQVARHYRLDCSEETVQLAANWNNTADIKSAVRQVARQAGLGIRFCTLTASELSAWRLPLIVQLRDGQIAVVDGINNNGDISLCLVSDQGLPIIMAAGTLLAEIEVCAVLRPLSGSQDIRIDSYIAPYRKNWLRSIIVREFKPYIHVMLAAMVANIMGLAGILFSMQVYDRVIPAQSMPTLYVLFSGVLLATLFAFIMNLMRSHVTDILGKRADIRVSDRVFGHAIRLRNSAKPRSTGTFISQLRELEQIRELITSSTVGAVSDLPFFFLFLLIFWLIATPVAWIPLVALIIMLAPSVLMQRQLAKCAQMAMRESSLRNALLVETIQGLEDVKSMQAELRFQQQWNQYNSATADASMAMRKLVHRLTSWSQSVQTAVFAVVVVSGAPLVMAGDMTTGALVAASILSSRMLAPMGQLTSILTRWQQAKVAMQSLNGIMQLPVDHPQGSHKVHRPVLSGNYQLQEAAFCYNPELPVPALFIRQLQIKAGERIAVLGRNGAGKSTLLQALAGGIDLTVGAITLDDINLGQLDPADVRRDIGLLTQNSRLFHGSVRDNLLLGCPLASDQELLEALSVAGAADILKSLPMGLNYQVMEGGAGLSGGQRQSLLLARLLLRQPNVLLLDEPSAALDDNTERHFIARLQQWLGGRTLIIATHRMAMLELVERIIVVDAGKIVLDAPKAEAIAVLSGTKKDR
ncbi:type I secretion system permease/ATPase [Chromatiaceae bacterium AAb-1]|nr:type I secretion system permease/ATPase [Chromatiaceae bacterium AAb-1]